MTRRGRRSLVVNLLLPAVARRRDARPHELLAEAADPGAGTPAEAAAPTPQPQRSAE